VIRDRPVDSATPAAHGRLLQPASFLSLLPLSSYYYYFSFKRKYFIKERRGELKERQRAEGEAAG
jgi:hypothetical protein